MSAKQKRGGLLRVDSGLSPQSKRRIQYLRPELERCAQDIANLASSCAGRCAAVDITLHEVQRIFLAPDWTKEYERYFSK